MANLFNYVLISKQKNETCKIIPVTGVTVNISLFKDLPNGASGEEPARQCRRPKRCKFSPWVGKIPWSKKKANHPVFLPGESLWTEEPGRL